MVVDSRSLRALVFLAALVVQPPAVVFGQTARQQPPVLTAFSINAGADSVSALDEVVSLTHTVVGTRPAEYRVSHRADFAGAKWVAYSPSPTIRDWYDASGASCTATGRSHRVTLYLQVRANVGEELRVVDGQRHLVPASVESNVLRATICARAVNEPSDPRPEPRTPIPLS